jgi:hypothetical protein
MSRPNRPLKQKRNYSGFTVKEAMQLIPAGQFLPWRLDVPVRPPSDWLNEVLRHRDSFDLENSELAKTLLIDALLWEIVPLHPNLKVWKAAPLETDTLTGTADYLISPKLAYITTPLLGVAEAKKDDFVQGRAQCLSEMVACQWNNRQENHAIDVYGIVSNGQGWQFYKLTLAGEIFETDQYGIKDLPGVLGALDYLCGKCAKNVP